MSIVSNSPRLATCARPALPTCSLRCWKISRGTRPHKEPLDEHSIERHARVLRLAANRTCCHVGDSATVLVGAARTMGVPLDLYRTPGRGHCLFARLFHHHALAASPHARRMARRSHRRASCIGYTLRGSGVIEHEDSSTCGGVLHSRPFAQISTRPK